MVTTFAPTNRVVSIVAYTVVDSPGLSVLARARAVTQPHETRTLEMVTALFVLFVTRKSCASSGPRGTEPKSFDKASKRPSAQVAAPAGLAKPRAATRTRR